MSKTSRKNKIIINIILSVLGIVWIMPIVFSFLNMFKTKFEYNLGSFWALPEGNAFMENVQYINANAKIFQGMFSSFLYAICGSVLALIIGTLAAYGIAHLRIKHKMFWFLVIYSGTIFPFQIYLIPVFNAYSKVGLYDTRLGMILFYTAICIPFIMFVLRNYFMGISSEICESAKLDGATDMQILLRIFVPMARAPLSVVLLQQFTWCWNDLMFGLTFTKSAEVKPVMASLSLMSAGNAPAMLMACIISSLPTIVFFILLNKNFEAGFAYSSK
ncbi:MAG: carbohydrate ABC transporter permease [Clostridiales bacterium]|nr:carbohydrate ABC transporter permease [Clostridiales bacterium]